MKHYLLPLLLLFSFNSWSQSCEIKVSGTKGCVPYPIAFDVLNSSSKTIQSYDWDFGNGSSSKQSKPTHVYSKSGIFKPSVKITYSDGTTCSASISIQVFAKPIAKIALPKEYKACFENRYIQLKDNSKPGADNAAIRKYLWDLDDGDTSSLKDPFHFYNQNKKYRPKLEITDKNGCKDTTSAAIEIVIFKGLKLNFIRYGRDSCPESKITFNNTTQKADTNGWFLNKVKWKFGDGNFIEASKNQSNWSSIWNSASHTYSKNGEFLPELVVENIFGCKDSFQRFNVENINFKFDIYALPATTLCLKQFDGKNVRVTFNQTPIEGAETWNWAFGDGGTQKFTWQPTHEYGSPGVYNVSLSVKVKGCIRDTMLCQYIKILGPDAKIEKDPNSLYNYQVGHEFPPKSFPDPTYFDTCNTDSMQYFTIDTTVATGPVHSYCYADTASKIAFGQTLACDGTMKPVYQYTLEPSKTVMGSSIKYEYTQKTWFKGDPLPSEKVFRAFLGNKVEGNIHDSFRFSCSVPHNVTFPNNSKKFRGYKAEDDNPPGLPDLCLNPTYPFASDSLKYIWDFLEGSNDTSTALKPNAFSRYSTERLPVHTFTKEGCYNVKLYVEDTVTKCFSVDSTYIATTKPNASFDRVAFDSIKYMTFDLQQKLKSVPYKRGIILDGLKCVGAGQKIKLNEIVPDCIQQDFWIVFDSAEQVTVSKCNGKEYVSYEWIDKKEIERRNYLYMYETPGWKTVGLVIKNGNCYDTAWYHNYKYMYDREMQMKISSDFICPGDQVGLTISDIGRKQQGVDVTYFTSTYRYWYSDTGVYSIIDTMDYYTFMGGNGKIIRRTSAVNNSESGVIDDSLFNLLDDTVVFKPQKPGHYLIVMQTRQRFGCDVDDILELTVGHHADFLTEQPVICLGDTSFFIDSVHYFGSLNATAESNGLNPDKSWHTQTDGEEIEWDFNNDGIIDATGPNPSFYYDKVGSYTVKMRTKDKLGCWQETIKKDFVKVISVKANFSVANDDSVRFCAPQFFVFSDSSKVTVPDSSVDSSFAIWRWNWGNGTEDIKSFLDNGQTGKQYAHNGRYRITLTAIASNYNITLSENCIDTHSLAVQINGPKPKFNLIGDTIGCVPFTATVFDQSQKTSIWDWRLGNGKTQSSEGEDTVLLHYDKPGTFCISLNAGDTIKDLNDSTFFCIDQYPYEKCRFKVTVKPKDPIGIVNDSMLCINQIGDFNLIDSNNKYSSYYIEYGDGNNDDGIDKDFQHSYGELDTFLIAYTGKGDVCADTGIAYVRTVGIKAALELDSTTIDTPSFSFFNQSLNATQWEWWVDQNKIDNNSQPFRHTFTKEGPHEVCIVAFNEANCPDTSCLPIVLNTSIKTFNVFTPNGDGQNDEFKVLIKGALEYKLSIFNRWGELVFETTDPNKGWDGKNQFNGIDCSPTAYFYILEYKLIGEDVKKLHGTVTLLR